MADARNDIVKWAKWGVENHGRFNYTEGPQRMAQVRGPGTGAIFADCSAFVTYCYSWAGVSDPNGLGYNGTGYTGTLLAHGTPITLAQVQPGDVIVYGPGTGWHTALIVEAGPDPLTVSHGQQGDPNYCRVSQDGRQPQRYLRFDTTKGGSGAVAPVAPSNPAQHVLVPGVSVKAVQRAVGAAQDGVWGPDTDAKVRQYQRGHGLVADGVVGPATWASMQGTAPTSSSRPTIKRGDSGQYVAAVQRRLKINPDGIFGPATEAAVRAFQQRKHLSVDGIVGPATWAAMGI
jgi:peptidoglycan hydrolase-like protein with peptidoglycan-binding domain